MKTRRPYYENGEALPTNPGGLTDKTKEVRTCEEGAACATLDFGLHMLDGIGVRLAPGIR